MNGNENANVNANAAPKQEDDSVLKKVRNLTFICSLIYIGVGIALMAAPDATTAVLGFVLGVLSFGIGIYRLVVYFTKQRIESYLATDLFLGVLLAVLGFVCLVHHDKVLVYRTLIFGVALIFGSCLKMQYSIILQKIGHLYWWLALILGLVSVIFSVMAIMKPSFIAEAFVVVVGFFLLYDGITSLAAAFLGDRFLRQLKKGVTTGWGHPPVPGAEPPASAGAAFEANPAQGGAQNYAAYAAAGTAAGAAAQQGMTGIPAPEQKEKKSFFSNLFSRFKKNKEEAPLPDEGLQHPQAGDPFSSTPSGDATMAGVSFDAGKTTSYAPAQETPAAQSTVSEAPPVNESTADTVVEESVPLTSEEVRPADEQPYVDPLPELKPDPIAPGEEMPKMKFDPETGKPLQ